MRSRFKIDRKAKMKRRLSLIMPAAGRGSRFGDRFSGTPKPLIELDGRPFFWWAVESVARSADIERLAFVVLEDHCRRHAIHQRIREFYPEAIVIPIPEVTAGAAETASLALGAVDPTLPLAVNDCDHAFLAPALPSVLAAMERGAQGGLLCFRASNPAYSYLELTADGHVAGVREKQVVSSLAIAGCYCFASPSSFEESYSAFVKSRPEGELFMSGLFQQMADSGREIAFAEVERHIAFGTPEELERLEPGALRQAFGERPDG
jgi:dTDP-glucose pyrophosphorylase